MRSLGKTLLVFALLHSVFQGQICLLLQVSLQKALATHSSTLAWKIPWTEEPGRLPDHGVAAANSLQSCPTLCNPIDGSPPGSSIPGILEVRTLEWVAIAFFGRSSIQSAKTRQGTDCCSVHELHVAKLRVKLKNVGKTTRPFRYDLNQIPYDYTVGVRNRSKGLDLIDRVPEELWVELWKRSMSGLYIVTLLI